MHPVIARVTAVEMHVVGIAHREFTVAESDALVAAYPRTPRFIQAFYDGIKQKPEATFGNVKANVLADKDDFAQGNFYSVIRGSD